MSEGGVEPITAFLGQGDRFLADPARLVQLAQREETFAEGDLPKGEDELRTDALGQGEALFEERPPAARVPGVSAEGDVPAPPCARRGRGRLSGAADNSLRSDRRGGSGNQAQPPATRLFG